MCEVNNIIEHDIDVSLTIKYSKDHNETGLTFKLDATFIDNVLPKTYRFKTPPVVEISAPWLNNYLENVCTRLRFLRLRKLINRVTLKQKLINSDFDNLDRLYEIYGEVHGCS